VVESAPRARCGSMAAAGIDNVAPPRQNGEERPARDFARAGSRRKRPKPRSVFAHAGDDPPALT
jgi:hypothetical protein